MVKEKRKKKRETFFQKYVEPAIKEIIRQLTWFGKEWDKIATNVVNNEKKRRKH